MSKELDKQTLVRSAWLTELRRQGDRKCTGELSDGLGKVCALGLLAEVAGISLPAGGYGDYDAIRRAAGMNYEQMDLVWRMNDGAKCPILGPPIEPHTFGQIADAVEGWFRV